MQLQQNFAPFSNQVPYRDDDSDSDTALSFDDAIYEDYEDEE